MNDSPILETPVTGVQTSEPPLLSPLAPIKSVRGGPSGTDFRLFKRADNGRELPKDAPGWRDRFYYFRFTYKGTSYARCLETTDSVDAQRRARQRYKEITLAVQREDYDAVDRTKLRQTLTCTVAQLVTVYRGLALDASEDTREQNINALYLILSLQVPGAAKETLEHLPVAAINGGLAKAWFDQARRRAAGDGPSADGQSGTDQRKGNSIKRSAKSRFGHVRSLFTPRALAGYDAAGLNIGKTNITAFLQAGLAHTFTRLPRNEYNPPSDEIITATLAAWEALQDTNLFVAIGLELSFGLRKREIAQARANWLSVRQGYPVIDAECKVKNGTGLLQVRAIDPFYTILKRKLDAGAPKSPTEYLIGGVVSHREDTIFRSVGHWLRDLGWSTQKTNHALRAYAGSQIAMKYGIYEAQTWLRHSTVKVTEDHYSHFVRKFKPSDPDALPVRWATLDPNAAPQLRILHA